MVRTWTGVREEADDVTEWFGEWTGVIGLPACIRSEGGSESRGDCEWG
jgi:hypothetical protein